MLPLDDMPMERPVPLLAATALLGALLAAACASDADLFGTGSGGSGGTGATTSTPTTTSAGGTTSTPTGTETGSATGTATGSTTGTPTGGGGSGGSSTTNCAHDVCELGGALASDCADCVSDVCDADPFCCANRWDYWCVDAAADACSEDCGAGLGDCGAQYGQAPGYVDCGGGAVTCTFGFQNNQYSCGQVCRYDGGECVGAYNNEGQCGFAEELGCQFVGFESALCICSRGCGVGPACPDNQSCSDGSCG